MMAGMPSWGALLGLVAVAGYQNRDKISDFVKNLSGGAHADQIPGGVTGSLGGLVEQMSKGGLGDVAKSWVGTGANSPINADQITQMLPPDLVSALTKQTGLTPDELLKRLTQTLPQVVDGLTPSGRLPG
ncbi:MAG: DUF937 domain-containing protein [Alphaproteobacteria bacterium]|nr:DUF937 domain-containing protein [Alphaproteobacteria bacterium]